MSTPSRLGLTSTPTALADWALASAQQPSGQRPASAERIAEVQRCDRGAVDLPTARLERLMAEHVDSVLVSARRLDHARSIASGSTLIRTRSEARGLHLGAFGWVENLRPAAARARAAAMRFRGASRRGRPRMFSDGANGGFIHAPSLTQAATAAVLRNGYLSHADSTGAATLRGQPLVGAHARGAGVGTRAFARASRLARCSATSSSAACTKAIPASSSIGSSARCAIDFPLLSGRLTDLPPGVSAEVVEARNVVDGLALVEATPGQAYPYGLAGLPAAERRRVTRSPPKSIVSTTRSTRCLIC